MKLFVKCNVGDQAGGTKEVNIRNPAATLSNVRAAIAINFRMHVYSFRMVHNDVDLSNESQLLGDTNLKDGDTITVVAKRDREDTTEEDNIATSSKTTTTTTTTTAAAAAAPVAASSQNKPLTTNATPIPPATSVATGQPVPENFTAANMDDNADGEGETEEDGDDSDLDGGPSELLSHLLETVPNLVEMREQFLENPTEIMQQIRDRDPHLFELIAANHQEFIDLVNNEALVETLQLEQDAADEEAYLDEEDDELDEATEEQLRSVLAQFMGSIEADGGADAAGSDAEGPITASETQRYLEREPTAEDEEKIEQLIQLGFTRDQCKVAFFKAKRSLERAANLLFEDPPQL